MKINFVDLKSQYALLKKEIDANIQTVLDHGMYVMGPEIIELETKLSSYTGSRHCVSCASGTDALVMALMAHGIGRGDVVITTPFTFIATAEAISFVGAIPLFVDIEIDTFNISSVALKETLDAIKDGSDRKHKHLYSDISDIKAIITVDLFGLPANHEEINPIAKEHGFIVIEDAAQGFGGEHNGIKAGNLADISCTSFFPAKPLGCYGDGGAVFTNDDDIAELLRSIRVHGQGRDKYENVRIGLTGRMDTIQAAILLPKLANFDVEIQQRQIAADLYTANLAGVKDIVTPVVAQQMQSCWAQYTVLARDNDHRQAIIDKLQENGIPAAIYYPIPLHMQKVFADLKYKNGDFPVSENASGRVFSLPMHPHLQEQDIISFCNVIRSV